MFGVQPFVPMIIETLLHDIAPVDMHLYVLNGSLELVDAHDCTSCGLILMKCGREQSKGKNMIYQQRSGKTNQGGDIYII